MRIRLFAAGVAVLVLPFAVALAGQQAQPAGQQQPQGATHAGSYAQTDIENGSRVYANQCSRCHGVGGDSIAGIDLRSGKFKRAETDEDLARVVTLGIPGTSMPPHKLEPREVTGIVAYLRTMKDFNAAKVAVGDSARGRALFENKGQCSTCHRVQGRGARTAPDLSDIGTSRAAAALQRSIVDPTGGMRPNNRPVRAVTHDGKVYTGRRLNEDTFTVQLIDEQERLVSLDKTNLKEYTVMTTSAMPSYKDKLDARSWPTWSPTSSP
jgi:putative heme-binding domain-containing protein